jgi:hypothetical protein
MVDLDYSDFILTIGVVAFIFIGLRILSTLRKIDKKMAPLDVTQANTTCYDEDEYKPKPRSGTLRKVK